MRCLPAVLAVCCALAVPALAQDATDLPPHVVACFPPPFATNVEVDTQEVSVTFDRPMNTANTGSWVSLRYLGAFPGRRGAQPRWDADGLTCYLPVKLEADVMYVVSINSARSRGFVDAAGRPAVTFAWAFATGERTPEDFPPSVVACDPQPWATDADFRARTVTVTFSRRVARGDFSWVKQSGSGMYPEGPQGGPPGLSEDGLSASIAVALSPATVYALSLNDVDYCGYKDLNGRPVLPYGFGFKTAP